MKIKDFELKWKGHSCFLIKTPEGKTIYIDPFKLENLIFKEKIETNQKLLSKIILEDLDVSLFILKGLSEIKVYPQKN